MGDWFGLGIMIEVRDFASQGLQQVANAFYNTKQAVDDFSQNTKNSLLDVKGATQHFQSMMVSGLGMQQAGSQFLNFSQGILSPLVAVTQQVATTGEQFENWRKTLKALYKDEALATEKLAWGMNLAATTPFEITDVASALVGFKAIGVEADTMMTSVNGVKQTMLEFVGDLASLRPDVGLQGVMLGVRNLLGGDGGKSLKMRLDMDLENILGRELGDTTEQLMQDIADISGKIANGLMGELEGTWGQLTSNLEDQATRFFLALGDNGMFDSLKKSLEAFSKVISSIDDDKMAKIGKNLSEAFSMIWKPIDLAIRGISSLIGVISELVASNSFLGKLVTGFLAVTGAVTGITGVVLTFGGSLITTVSSLGLFLIALQGSVSTIHGTRTMFQLLGSTMLGTLATVGRLAGAFALGFAVWKFDIGGIRTMATSFVNTILYAFQESAKISRMGSQDMINAVAQLDMTNFGDRLTYRLLQLRVLWQAVCEAWSDYTLSDETFKKVQALGLLPLLEAILDFKMKFDAFWKGFKDGFKTVTDTLVSIFSKVGEVIGEVINFFFPINTEVDKTKQSIGEGLNLAPWELFGTMVGGIASVLATGLIGMKIFDIAKKIGGIGLAIIKLPFNIIKTVIGAFTSLGNLIKFVGGIFSSLGGVVFKIAEIFAGLLGKISRAIPLVGRFVQGLLTFGTAHPVIAIIGVVLSALLPIFIKLWKESESFRTGVIQLGQGILAFIGAVALSIGAVIGAFVTGVVAVVTLITQVIASAVVIVVGLISSIAVIIGSVIAVIVGIISTAVALVISIITGIVAVVMTIGTIIQGIFQTAFAIVVGIVQTFLAVVHAVMTGDFTSLGDTLKSIWSGVGNRIGEIWSNVSSKIKSIWSGVQSFLSGLWNNMKSLWSGICNGIKSAGTNVVNGIKSAWSGVTGFFSGIWNGIKSSASSMFDWISNKFSWVSDKISSIKGAMGKIGDGISSVFGKKDGSHANGLSYVPYDGYIAELHKGEMVLTAQESKKYRKQSRGLLEGQTSNTVQPTNTQQLVEQVTIEPVISPFNIEPLTSTLNLEPKINDLSWERLVSTLTVEPLVKTLNNIISSPTEGNLDTAKPVPQVVNANVVTPTPREKTPIDTARSNLITLANTQQTASSSNPQTVDNSVVFNEGSIQINVQNGEDLDLDAIAKQLMKKIQREQQLRSTLKYKPAL